MAALLLDVVLLVLFGTALSSCVNYPLSTSGQASAVGTIVSAGYGFVCGAYMPISNFTGGLQKVGRAGFPAEVVEAIRDSVDCNLYFFGSSVSRSAMYLVLIAATVLILGLYVAMNALWGKKRR